MSLLNLLWYVAGCLVALIVIAMLLVIVVSLIIGGINTWKKK